MPAVDDEVVAFRLQPDGAIDRGRQQIVVGGGAKWFAQIGGILVAKAGMQRAGAGDPYPITGLAEIMRHRRDETELAAGLGNPDIAGWAAGIVVEVDQRVVLGEAGAQKRQRYVLIDPAFA